MAHRPLWGQEVTPTKRDLTRLHADDASLYDDLRLEQERIGYAWVQAALAGYE